ncbi:N-6 DNA methylase [Ideonella sp. B508-1]|uniref:N-6 DNA methylase n=1 Tax=Ideonella sp. B508-1 TaxID=137716 RepID=UPI000345690B|nr:N-6 DNA methylase [Ideonella sp. B508-1]
MAKKQHARTGTEHQNALARTLRQIAHRHSLWTVFRDFVALSALTLSNAADRSQAEAREKEYLQIAGRYSREELGLMSEGFAHVVMGLETGHQDFLGSLFMLLEMGDSWKGQFFTPYHLCLCMSKMTMSDAGSYIRENGFVRVSDPCVGGGAMIIAAAHSLMDDGINYQQHMHAVAQDIDLTAVHMAYIQFSLLHIPAVVIHGNSLAMETRSTWRTLAHTMGRWDAKLQRLEQAQAIAEAAELMTQPEAERPTPAPVAAFVPSEEARRAANDPHAVRKVRRPSQVNQISLF